MWLSSWSCNTHCWGLKTFRVHVVLCFFTASYFFTFILVRSCHYFNHHMRFPVHSSPISSLTASSSVLLVYFYVLGHVMISPHTISSAINEKFSVFSPTSVTFLLWKCKHHPCYFRAFGSNLRLPRERPKASRSLLTFPHFGSNRDLRNCFTSSIRVRRPQEEFPFTWTEC